MVKVKGLSDDLIIESLVNQEEVLILAKFWNFSIDVKWFYNHY